MPVQAGSLLHSAWEALSTPQMFSKRDSARSFEEHAFANFGTSGKRKLMKTDSARSETGNDRNSVEIVAGKRSWKDFLLCRSSLQDISTLS